VTKCPEKHMWKIRCEKNLFLFAYLLTEFSDFKVLFQIITIQDLHGVYQNCNFFNIYTTFQLTINIVNK